MERKAKISRKTNETDINLEISLNGNGETSINSGNGFLDHMLDLFAKHGLFNLDLKCNGDTDVDFHHSAEDIAICLGSAFDKALGNRKGINRYATQYLPMDESLARVVIDIGGRPNLVYKVELTDRKINNFECDLVEDFFKAFTDTSRMTIHIDLLRGRNSHHSIEAIFKAFGRALSFACDINPKASDQIPSSKGII